MNKILHFKKVTIIGFSLSVLMVILHFITEIPFLTALIFFLSLISIITTCLMLIEIFKRRSLIDKKQVINSVVISVIFLPILCFFILASYEFSQKTRVDIINNTNQTVDYWEIKGCINLWRTNHYPKQKETIWIDLTGDCSVDIEYIQQGIKKRKTIVGNLKPGLFSKIEFYIQPE